MKLFTAVICLAVLQASAGASEKALLAVYGEAAFRPDRETLCILTDRG